jgi:hypothetical protein
MATRRVPREHDPLESHDVMLALSEARAAHWMLEELHSGGLEWRLRGSSTRGWVEGWAIAALGRSLDEAEAALRKMTPPEMAAQHSEERVGAGAQGAPRAGRA